MKLTPREAALSWLVGVVVLLSLTYGFGAPKVKVWKETVENQKSLVHRIALSERVLQQRNHWTRRLDVLKTKLSKYPAEKDVTADYLKILERVAKENNVSLVQRRPQKEKKHGDLYELAIDSTWEGSLEGLVRFLYALEQEPVSMDVEDLMVSLAPGGKGQMKGNFTLICIYCRNVVEPSAPAEKSSAPKAAKS